MINLNEQYPNKTAGVTPNYPFGQARNVILPGDRKGTPWDQALVNDLLGFQQAAMKAANMVPSGVPDNANNSQVLSAIEAIFLSYFPALLSTNGYIKIPTLSISGKPLILQWGKPGLVANGTVITFPIAYTTQVFGVFPSDYDGSSVIGAKIIDLTKFSTRSGSAIAFSYFSIGY